MASPSTDSPLSERRPGWPSLDDILQGSHELPRWIGWRLRALVGAILLGCALFFLVAHWLSAQPRLPFALRATPEGLLKIQAVDYPPLQRMEGHVVEGLQLDITGASSQPGLYAPLDLLMLQRSGRWIIDPTCASSTCASTSA